MTNPKPITIKMWALSNGKQLWAYSKMPELSEMKPKMLDGYDGDYYPIKVRVTIEAA